MFTGIEMQPTALPPQAVTDADGKPLRTGDLVVIRARVEAVNPSGYGCNVVLRTEEDMPGAAFYGPHKSQLHLHGMQCRLAERSTR